MEIDNLNMKLTEGQARFALWVESEMPFLMNLFDFENAAFKADEVERYLGVASHGEVIMAKFALGVWRHQDEFQFDFIQATRVLDSKHMKVITDWMRDPFWP